MGNFRKKFLGDAYFREVIFHRGFSLLQEGVTFRGEKSPEKFSRNPYFRKSLFRKGKIRGKIFSRGLL